VADAGDGFFLAMRIAGTESSLQIILAPDLHLPALGREGGRHFGQQREQNQSETHGRFLETNGDADRTETVQLLENSVTCRGAIS